MSHSPREAAEAAIQGLVGGAGRYGTGQKFPTDGAAEPTSAFCSQRSVHHLPGPQRACIYTTTHIHTLDGTGMGGSVVCCLFCLFDSHKPGHLASRRLQSKPTLRLTFLESCIASKQHATRTTRIPNVPNVGTKLRYLLAHTLGIPTCKCKEKNLGSGDLQDDGTSVFD